MNIDPNALLSGYQTYGLAGVRTARDAPPNGLPVDEVARARPAGRDSASISDAARRSLAAEAKGSKAESKPNDELTPEEKEQVRELQARDREVRAHEQAHKSVAGDLATGGPTYTYQSGPDGKRYAIGGEVKIQLRPGKTPEETVRNMERARRAALAPAEPSGPDRAVAAKATQLAAQARAEAQAAPESEEGDPAKPADDSAAQDESPPAQPVLDLFA